MKSKTFRIEKDLVKHIQQTLKNYGITCFKTHGDLYQSGLPDLIVFNKYMAYGLEIKRDFKTYQPSKLQIAMAKEVRNNFIYLFIDKDNYSWVIELVISNNKLLLNEYAKMQLFSLLKANETPL